MTPNSTEKMRLVSHFGFSKMPFAKHLLAKDMYESKDQAALRCGLDMWLDIGGLALVSGPVGVGKSMNIRRFVNDLDNTRFAVYIIPFPTVTVYGFLRCLCRKFGQPLKNHTTDLFDTAQKFLINHEKEMGTHPILILDDAEGLYPEVADVVKSLTVYDLDAEDRFSILVCGIESLLDVLEAGVLLPLRSRFSFGHSLKPFGLDDTHGYIQFHLKRAGADPNLFSEEVVKRIFHISQGRPRTINQLAIGSLILAAMKGKHAVDGPFFKSFIAAHPLYHNQGVQE